MMHMVGPELLRCSVRLLLVGCGARVGRRQRSAVSPSGNARRR
jgi:hypothetical protein